MINNIFDRFFDENIEDRLLRVSTRLRVTARKGVSVAAFLAVGVANAYAGNPHAPSNNSDRASKNIQSYSIPAVNENYQFTRNVTMMPGASSGYVENLFQAICLADSNVSSEIFYLSRQLPRWFEKLTHFDLNGNAGGALEILMEAVDSYEETGRWAEFSDTLMALKVDQFSSISLVGILRMSFAHRAEIPFWQKLAADVKRTLTGRGEDVNRTMSGLT